MACQTWAWHLEIGLGMVDDLPGLRECDAFLLLAGEGVVGGFEHDARTEAGATVVDHGFELEGGLRIVRDFVAEPTEERADVGGVEVIAVVLEVFVFVGDPNTEAEFVVVVEDGNFNDATDEIITVLDDAQVGSKQAGGVVGHAVRPYRGGAEADMGRVCVLLAQMVQVYDMILA